MACVHQMNGIAGHLGVFIRPSDRWNLPSSGRCLQTVRLGLYETICPLLESGTLLESRYVRDCKK